MTVISRFKTIKRGGIHIAGNTLGLAGNSSFLPSGPGNVQAFITTDTTVATATGWSGVANLANNENVTNQWLNNSAAAYVNLPEGSTVLYAELLWPSSVSYSSTVLPIAEQNIAVKLRAPDNTLNLILPDTITMQSAILSPPASQFNVRSADVTNILQEKGNGKYIVGGVPCYLNYPGNVALGWALVIAYENISEPWRSLSINVSNELVNPSTTVDVPVYGFVTPENGVVNGRTALVAIEGDNWNGDSVRFGPNLSSLTILSGANNPVNNFFSSQINNNNGNLDTTGTFGTRNFYPPGATTPIGARQGFDITNVSVNGIMSNNQSSGVFRFQTSSDGYIVNSIALQLDSNSANLTPIIKIADKGYAELGDTISYTVILNNSGSTTAFNIRFIDTIPNEATFISNSVIINGIPYLGVNPNPPGFMVDNMPTNSKTTITFKVIVNTIPSQYKINNRATAQYSFIIGNTIPAVLDQSLSIDATTTIVYSILEVNKTTSKEYAQIGDEIIYNIVIKNNGNTTANNITVIDTVPNNTSLILNSFKQDVTTILQINNFINQLLPNNIGAMGVSTITFKVLVESIPINNPMENIANISGRYIVNPILQTLSKQQSSQNTNITTTSILVANLNGTIKFSDKKYVTIGDTITYTVVIPNNGNTQANNCIFIDTIPIGTNFVENSVEVDGLSIIGVNPSIGINLGTIPVSGSKTITFKVIVQ